MDVLAAAALIEPAVPHPGGTWADLGAGTGTFTLGLATLLGPTARVFAVERDTAALHALRHRTAGMSSIAKISSVHADFTGPIELPALEGVLLANALHYVPDTGQPDLLRRLSDALKPGGRIVVVEYEGRGPSRWVPYPVSFARLREVARDAGLSEPTHAGYRRSMFGGTMYVAFLERRRGSPAP